MQFLKRTLSALLAVVMVIALFPAVAFAEAVTLEEFAQSQLLETVDFSKLTLTKATGQLDFNFKSSDDGTALHVYGGQNAVDGNAWNADVCSGYTAGADTVYTMTYKIWMDPDAKAKDTNGVYVGVGGVQVGSGTTAAKMNYLTFSTNLTSETGLFRGKSGGWTGKTSSSISASKPATEYDYDTDLYTYVYTDPDAAEVTTIEDKAYHTIRLTFDGPNKKATAYILKAGESGVHADDWVQWQSTAYTPVSGSLKFNLTMYDYNLDCIIRDVNYYQGDIVCAGNKTETARQDATCGADGSVTYTCKCGEITTEPLEATGNHNYVDGVCSVCQAVLDPVASVNDVNYGSLEAAIAAATEEDTIKLLKDSTVSSPIEISQNVTIAADQAVTITAADDIANMFNLAGGKLTVAGNSEGAKITLAAGKMCTAIILGNGGDCDITNTVLAGNTETSIDKDKAHGFSSDAATGTYTFTNVDIRDVVHGDGIRAAKTGQVVNLDNVTIDNTGRYGIYAIATVNIFNNQHADKALMISNTYDHCIDVKDNGTVISHLENVDEGVYPIQLDTTKKSSGRGIIVRDGSVLNITDVSIQNVQHNGVELYHDSKAVEGIPYAIASISNAIIDSKGYGIATVADSSLTVSNVTVQKCGENAVNILGNLTGEITFAEHNYVAGETVAPTCLVDGYTPYICSVCGDSYNGDVVEAPGEHDHVGAQTKAPTCVDPGEMTYTCSRCGDFYTEEIDPTGEHTYDENGNCTGCDASLCQHTYAEEVTTQPTCTEKGVKTFTCTVEGCGYSYTEEIAELGHSYDDECDTDCNVCGDVRTAPTAVASIGTVNYGSLEAAVAAANEAAEAVTITILKDLEISSQLVITTDMTITANEAVTIAVSEGYVVVAGISAFER